MDDVIEAEVNDMGEIEVRTMCPYCGSIWRITEEDMYGITEEGIYGHTLFSCPICGNNIYIPQKYFNRSDDDVS